MVDNYDAAYAVISDFWWYKNSNGIYSTKYMEYTTGDPAMGYGIVIETSDNSNLVSAIKRIGVSHRVQTLTSCLMFMEMVKEKLQ